MPPAFRNHRAPTACGIPAAAAASSLDDPTAMAAQKALRSPRPATGGRPGECNGALPARSDRRFGLFITTSSERTLRRPVESALRALIAMVDDVLGLAGGKRHVESVEHNPRLQVAREGPSDNPARPCVHDDGQEQEASERGHEGDVGHPQFVRLLDEEVPSNQVVRRPMAGIAPCRRDASAPAGADEPGCAHQAGHALLADGDTLGLEFSMDSRRAIGFARSRMDRANLAGEIGVGCRPR